MKNTLDLIALGLIFVGIFIFRLSLREVGFTMWIGLIGSLVLIITEIIFLFERWFK